MDALQIARLDVPIEASHVALFQWDAQRLPFATASVDVVVSNLPWGKQVSSADDLPALYRASFAEMQRVVKPGGSIVLLTSQPELLPQTPDEQIEISLFGETPKIVRFSL